MLRFALAAVSCLWGSVALAEDCLLQQPGTEESPALACLQCHDGSRAKSHLQTGHPVDLAYAQAQSLRPGELRPEAEVVARGGFLPQGMLRCTTCHSARSPWARHLNLPPNAKARPAVNPFDPATYEVTPIEAPAAGSEVSAKPLCLLCHALD